MGLTFFLLCGIAKFNRITCVGRVEFPHVDFSERDFYPLWGEGSSFYFNRSPRAQFNNFPLELRRHRVIWALPQHLMGLLRYICSSASLFACSKFCRRPSFWKMQLMNVLDGWHFWDSLWCFKLIYCIHILDGVTDIDEVKGWEWFIVVSVIMNTYINIIVI